MPTRRASVTTSTEASSRASTWVSGSWGIHHRISQAVAGLQISARKEFDRLGGGDGFDVTSRETDLFHAGHDLALKFRIVEFAGHHATGNDLSGRCDGEFQDQLALQVCPVTQCATV